MKYTELEHTFRQRRDVDEELVHTHDQATKVTLAAGDERQVSRHLGSPVSALSQRTRNTEKPPSNGRGGGGYAIKKRCELVERRRVVAAASVQHEPGVVRIPMCDVMNVAMANSYCCQWRVGPGWLGSGGVTAR